MSTCVLCVDRKYLYDPETGEELCPCPICQPSEYNNWFHYRYDHTLSIKGWQKEAQKYTHAKLGWWLKGRDQVPLALCYLHSEISEDFEKWRDNENLGEDLADLALRLFQTAADLNIDLECEMKKKMKINWARPPKHGKARVS